MRRWPSAERTCTSRSIPDERWWTLISATISPPLPHGPLMRCVSRRVADGAILSVLKHWLTVPVWEHTKRGAILRSTQARDQKRGTPQGGTASPLLANLYFRRFLRAWYEHGHCRRLDAHVVNYVDDLVICCRPGNGAAALATMRRLIDAGQHRLPAMCAYRASRR